MDLLTLQDKDCVLFQLPLLRSSLQGFSQTAFEQYKSDLQTQDRYIIKWIDHFSPNCKTVLQSYIPAGIKKCLQYALTEEDIIYNLRGFYGNYVPEDTKLSTYTR